MENTAINIGQPDSLEKKNYQNIISLDASDRKVFESVLDIPLWWTEMFEGASAPQGAKFTVRFGPSVYKTIVVEELIDNAKVVWKVVDNVSDIPELENKSEWIGTTIIWEISAESDNTILKLTHIGLTPEVECYTICEQGWRNFTDSLVALVKTGKGNPFRI